MASVAPLRIVITGGTGQIGHILARHFHERGHAVTVIARHPVCAEWQCAHWDAEHLGDWVECLDGADVIINLAGRSVNCRYTHENRHEIKLSRVISTALVGQAIQRVAQPPAVWLNASTATIYRQSFDKPMDESSEIGGNEPDAPSAWAFSIDVATSWERAFFAAETPRTRKVALRTAMVMSPDTGGIFDTLLRLVRYGLGGQAASGQQYVSWIHDVDYIRAIELIIERPDFSGPVNIASPCPITNREFMCCLRRAWCTSYIGVPSPRWVLRVGALLMRTETELILKSRRVVPGRLRKSGFDFHFPNWRSACQDLVHRWRELNGD